MNDKFNGIYFGVFLFLFLTSILYVVFPKVEYPYGLIAFGVMMVSSIFYLDLSFGGYGLKQMGLKVKE